ncbi:MAG: peptidoglycan-binding protein [Candidatus Omnitrophica bacterium]|nr:peptidoglycan-binding protein [Candidatus Omnitrophota bacterium]
MAKKVLLLGLAAVFVFSLSGCTTMHKNDALEIQGLRNKVSALEAQLKERDDELNSLREASVKGGEYEAGAGEAKQQADARQIQTALKNAGYYQGTVDGKLGKKTRRAVREFQKANNLPVDGKVGRNTWVILKDYLDKKVK